MHTHLAPDYPAILLLDLIHAVDLDRKLSYTHLGLYQVINQPCQLTKQVDFTIHTLYSFSPSGTELQLVKFNFCVTTFKIIRRTMIY